MPFDGAEKNLVAHQLSYLLESLIESGPKGWCQQSYWDSGNRFCVIGRLLHTAGINAFISKAELFSGRYQTQVLAIRRLTQAIPSKHAPSSRQFRWWAEQLDELVSVTNYNDRVTFEDVVQLVEQALRDEVEQWQEIDN